MSDTEVDLSDERYDKHREAGEILATVREETAKRVDIGVGHLEVAEFAEDRIRELGGSVAFPVNISVDEVAAHDTPDRDDERTFGEEMINIDLGVHIDGWLADTAITVDFTGNDMLVEASAEALDAAIERIGPGVETGEIGAAIESTIDGYGFNPVVNLTGHGLGHWDQHTEPNIPNRDVEQGIELEPGQVVAIEPFATDGGGKVTEGSRTEIYKLDREDVPVRDRQARAALDQITDEFRTLPFALRWLETRRPAMAIRRLEQHGIVDGYPILKEDDGFLVSQKEHTVIVTETGCEVTTT
ncbi:MAG: type II methionyl aminopeptidase [Halobacteriota archaeon]